MAYDHESSKFIEAFSNFSRLERISCLGSACKMFLHEDFFRVAIGSQKQKPIGFWHVITIITKVSSVCSVVKKSCSGRVKKVVVNIQIKKPLYFFASMHVLFWQHQRSNLYNIIIHIGNFFFNFKVCHKIDGNLLHSYGFLIVDILNFKSYAIGSGHAVASLPSKLQSQVIFFQVLFFVS